MLHHVTTAINPVLQTAQPGDTLEVAGGVYDEVFHNRFPSGASWDAPIRIVAAPGATVWIRPSSGDTCIWLNEMQAYIEFDGINIDASSTNNGAMKIEGWSVSQGNPHHIRFKNAEVIGSRDHSSIAIIFACLERGIIGGNELINVKVHGGGLYDRDHGLYCQSGDNLIENCEFYDLAGAGVQFYNGYGIAATGNVIRNTKIHSLRPGCAGDNGAPGRHSGIYAYSQNNLRIENVVIATIPNNGGGCQGIEISADNVELLHCTITGIQGPAVIVTSGTGHAVRNSILWNNEGGIYGDAVSEGNLIDVDPKFVGGADFHLQAGSPAIDLGVGTNVSRDLDNKDRQGAPDAGVYEYTDQRR